MPAHITNKKTYILVWVVLMCLTGLTGGLSFLDMHQWNAVVAFIIAAAKASLVGAFFMHILYEEEKVVWLWAGVGIFWLGLLMIMTIADYVTRGFLRVPGK